jgi:hypothetical protein
MICWDSVVAGLPFAGYLHSITSTGKSYADLD